MPIRVIGGVFDSYVEQLVWNAPTYPAPLTDSFYVNAVFPLAPYASSRVLNAAYATNATTDNWTYQVRQLNKQV
jgi:hypothetical protein